MIERRFSPALYMVNNSMLQENVSMNEGRLYHILIMAAYLWQDSKQVKNNPADYMIHFIENNYGEDTVVDGMSVLNTLRSQDRMLSDNGREDVVYARLLKAAACFAGDDLEGRMRILAFCLALTMEVEGFDIKDTSKEKLYAIASLLSLEDDEVDLLLSMVRPEETNPRTGALRVLGLGAEATREEVKSAYRRLSLKYHPDRNLDKNERERQEAERMFKEIVTAKQLLDSIPY